MYPEYWHKSLHRCVHFFIFHTNLKSVLILHFAQYQCHSGNKQKMGLNRIMQCQDETFRAHPAVKTAAQGLKKSSHFLLMFLHIVYTVYTYISSNSSWQIEELSKCVYTKILTRGGSFGKILNAWFIGQITHTWTKRLDMHCSENQPTGACLPHKRSFLY